MTPIAPLKTLLLSSVLVLGAVLWIAAESQVVNTYKGDKSCVSCHRLSDKAIVAGFQASPLTHALMAADDEGAIEGDFSKAPIKKEDVAWVLCSKRPEQNYLDKNLQLLPATWDSEGKEWHGRSAVDAAKECLGCHTTGFDPKKRTWVSPGVGCESCHGPQSAHASSPSRIGPTKIASLPVLRQAMVCGQCHSGGRAKNGDAFLTGFKPGMDLDKVWDNEPKTGPGNPNTQFNQWRASKHAEKTPCSGCHDPHNTTGQPRLLRKPVNQLCGDCHTEQADMAKHAPRAEKEDTCATCHMPDGDHRFEQE